MQLTPSRVRIQKLGKAAGIAIAENIVLKRKVDELTTASSSRQKRKALDQSVLSKGRLITMDEVEQIRKEEEERKAKETERRPRQQNERPKQLLELRVARPSVRFPTVRRLSSSSQPRWLLHLGSNGVV